MDKTFTSFRLPEYTEFDLTVSEDIIRVGETFPSVLIQQRWNRLQLYYDLYSGVWHDLTNERLHVRVNYFQQMADTISQIFNMGGPTLEGVEVDEVLQEDLQDITETGPADSVRYGTTVVRAFYEEDEETIGLECLDPRYFIPTTVGWMVIKPFVSAASDSPDMTDRIKIEKYRYEDPEVAEVSIHRFSGNLVSGTIDNLVESYEVPAIPDGWVAIPTRPKKNDFYGTSAYESMIPPVFEYSRTMSSSSRLIDTATRAFFVAVMGPDDYEELFDIDTNSDGFEAQAAKINKGLREVAGADNGYFVQQPWMQDIKLLQASLDGLSYITEHLEELKFILSQLGHTPTQQRGAESTPSGTAMRRTLIGPYGAFDTLHNRWVTGVNRVVKAAWGDEAEYVLQPSFEMLEAEGPHDREGVEDENVITDANTNAQS